MGNHIDPRFTDADAEIIRRKAKRLAGHCGYRTSDVEDIEQDLAMHVFQQTHRHDPERGTREKFVSKIVKNKLLNIVESRNAKKRDVRRERMLDPDKEMPQLGLKGDEGSVDVKMDIAGAMAGLPEDLRDLALRLMTDQKAEAGRAANLSPQQMKTAVARIAKHFREMGLDMES